MAQSEDIRQRNRGIATGVMCYLLWGLFPLYWKLLAEVDSLEVIAHRIIWCFVTTVAICAIGRLDLVGLLRKPRAWRYLAPAAVIIALLTGVFLFGEPFTLAHGVCLGCIWAGLALVAVEAIRSS